MGVFLVPLLVCLLELGSGEHKEWLFKLIENILLNFKTGIKIGSRSEGILNLLRNFPGLKMNLKKLSRTKNVLDETFENCKAT